jgi:hypothetical protein
MMTPIMTWLLVVAAVSIPVASWIIWRERKSWQRVEGWRCPRCGQTFGPQNEHRGWGVKANPRPRDVATHGPLLHCSACGGEFPFSWRGEFVTQWKIYDARFSS